MIKITILFLIIFLSACGPSNSPVNVKGHINRDVIKSDQSDIPELISEDFEHRRIYGNVQVVNPFLEDVDVVNEPRARYG